MQQSRGRDLMVRGSQRRRQLLGAIGSGFILGVAGCAKTTTRPAYERRTVDVPADAEPRTPREATAAATQAITTGNNAVAPIDGIDVTDHEFVFESGYLGATVQGAVENRTGGRIDIAEVRVRVYNANDQLLGQYLDRVADLDGGETWGFTVILLESPADIAAYDIAALGTPGG